jgi:uncharacterized membrane protein
MILTVIIVLILLLIVSVHLSGVYLAREQKSYYWKFVLTNAVVLIAGITRIYYLTQHDEKGVRFLLWTLIFMFVQIVMVLLSALVLKFLMERDRKRTEV